MRPDTIPDATTIRLRGGHRLHVTSGRNAKRTCCGLYPLPGFTIVAEEVDEDDLCPACVRRMEFEEWVGAVGGSGGDDTVQGLQEPRRRCACVKCGKGARRPPFAVRVEAEWDLWKPEDAYAIVPTTGETLTSFGPCGCGGVMLRRPDRLKWGAAV